MQHFDSPTQYDKAYLGIENNRSTCSFFSLLTAAEFLKDGDISRKKHLANLDTAVGNYLHFDIRGHLSFFELLEFNDTLNDTDVSGTNAMWIKDGTLGYNTMFEPQKEIPRYAVILLKSNKFFVVLVDQERNSYHVRDCHNLIQYDFPNRKQLEGFLRDHHEFETQITVTDPDGTVHVVDEFSNIEYLIVAKPLVTKFDPNAKPLKKEVTISFDGKKEGPVTFDEELGKAEYEGGVTPTAPAETVEEDEELQRALMASLNTGT